MQESGSMHKSPAPVRYSRMNQARSEEDEKEREKDRNDRGQEADGKNGSPKNKNMSDELKQGLARHSRSRTVKYYMHKLVLGFPCQRRIHFRKLERFPKSVQNENEFNKIQIKHVDILYFT